MTFRSKSRLGVPRPQELTQRTIRIEASRPHWYRKQGPRPTSCPPMQQTVTLVASCKWLQET